MAIHESEATNRRRRRSKGGIMPTVPGSMQAQMAQQYAQRPTPEQLLMTAADMKSRGQLYQDPTDYSDPKATLKLPFAGGGRGQRTGDKKAKRR